MPKVHLINNKIIKYQSYLINFQAIRVFVESVLRFGLPVNFQGMILLPQKKTSRKLRDTLQQMYAHLDSTGGPGAQEVSGGGFTGVGAYKCNFC